MFKKFRENPYWKAGLGLLLVGGILIVFNNWIKKTQFSVGFETIGSTLAPIFTGVIFAFLLCPVYNFFVKKTYNKLMDMTSDNDGRHCLTVARVVATIICMVILVGFIAVLIYSMVPQVVNNCINLTNTLPERLAGLSAWLSEHFGRFPQLAVWVAQIGKLQTEDIVVWVQKNVLGDNAVGIATMISSGVMAAVGTVIDAFVSVVIMVYLLNYKETLFSMTRKFVAAVCSTKTQNSLFEFTDIFNETFIGFIVGRIIDSSIIGVLTYIVLLICKIPFAPTIALIVGVTNVIPFFGPFIGAIPSILILMLEDPMKALWFAVIILIIQQIDGNIIGPKCVGNAIGIGSFWVLIAVLLGGGLFGFAGMIFGVPVFAVLYRYINKVITKKLQDGNKAARSAEYFTLDAYGIDEAEIAEPAVKKSRLPDKLRKRVK